MISAICTPCRVVSRRDLETRIKLLEPFDTVKGLEIIGSFSDFSFFVRDIVANVEEARKRGISVFLIHMPADINEAATSRNNISLLKRLFFIASVIGAQAVVLHCESLLVTEIKKGSNEKVLLGKFNESLVKVDRRGIALAIENTPGVIFDLPNYRPLFSDPLELYRFCQKAEVNICFDTCHWGSMASGMSPLTIFKKIERKVTHLHVSDVIGVPTNKSRYQEGIVLGKGDLGESIFRKFIRYLRDHRNSVTLTAEAMDKDIRDPIESRESLVKIFEWLK